MNPAFCGAEPNALREEMERLFSAKNIVFGYSLLQRRAFAINAVNIAKICNMNM